MVGGWVLGRRGGRMAPNRKQKRKTYGLRQQCGDCLREWGGGNVGRYRWLVTVLTLKNNAIKKRFQVE